MSTTATENALSGGKALRRVSLVMRRAAILALYGGYAASATLWHISRTHHSTLLTVAALAVLAGAATGAFAVFYRTGYVTWGNAPNPSLDERQLAERNRLYGHCYGTFFILVLVALLYGHIAADAGWWLPDRNLDAEWIFWGVFVVGMTLPSAMLAWFDRPLPDEE